MTRDVLMPPLNALQRNPFHVIGATTRDTADRVRDLGEEKGLFGDEEACRDAVGSLLNPKRRLAAEAAWMPGVSPGRARQVMEAFEDAKTPPLEGLPPLAQANVLAALLETETSRSEAPNRKTVLRLTDAIDSVEVEEVLRDINEERSVASFGSAPSPAILSAEIESLRERHLRSVRSALDILPSRALATTMGSLADTWTASGTKPPPAFGSDIVDGYEVAAFAFAETQISVISQILGRARDNVGRGEAYVTAVLSDVESPLDVFSSVLGPVAVAKRARGSIYEPYKLVALSLRSLMLEMHNEHDWLVAPTFINRCLAKHFGGLDFVANHVAQDEDHLATMASQAAKKRKQEEDYARSITYAAEIGKIGKTRVEISPQGFRWKETHIPLAAITRLRWGATRHSVNGISTGMSFTVSVGDDSKMAVVSLGDQAVYEALIDRLWRTAGVRLLIDYLNRLKSSGAVIFPNFVLREDGVVVTRHRVLGTNESVPVTWPNVHVWSQGGNFFVGQKGNKRVYSQLGYQTHDNVAVIEHLIRTFFKSEKARPSEMLG